MLWHPTLERFGAGQPNDRFRTRFERGRMDLLGQGGWE